MNQDERITNLEIKLSFSEDLLEELNQTVFKQQQRIELLVKEIQALKLQMASNMPSDGNSPGDERPPHYWYLTRLAPDQFFCARPSMANA